MADLDMRRLIDAITHADAGMSVNMIKVNEDIKMLQEAGEEVAQKICHGALDGKTIGNYLMKKTEFKYDEADDWSCAYNIYMEYDTTAEVTTKEHPATRYDPPEAETGNMDCVVTLQGYVVFGGTSGGFIWLAQIEDYDVQGEHFTASDVSMADEVEGEGSRPLEALKALFSNIDTEIDHALDNMSSELDQPEPDFDFDDRW